MGTLALFLVDLPLTLPSIGLVLDPPTKAIAKLIASELAADQRAGSPLADNERRKWPW